MKNSGKALCILSSLLLLTGCQEDVSYKLYYGKMFTSSASATYIRVKNKEIVNKVDENETISYYCDIFTLKTDEDLSTFEADYRMDVSESEMNTITSDFDEYFYIYFLTQIPAGYRAYKRENTQTTDTSGTTILVTPSMFSYANRPNMVYCYIDEKEDETVTSNYLYIFYYQIERAYEEDLTADIIRPILNLN